jgi:type IV secretion system protein VirB8
LARLPRHALVEVRITGISSLSDGTSLVRFVTVRSDPGGQAPAIQPWQAVIAYRFSGAAMSAADRLLNPLGFQVTRYRRDAEMPMDGVPQGSATPAAIPAGAPQPSSPPAIPYAAPGATAGAVVPGHRP